MSFYEESCKEPNYVLSSNNELECAVACLVQLNCIFFNYIESERRCELFQYQPINYEVLPGYLPNKVSYWNILLHLSTWTIENQQSCVCTENLIEIESRLQTIGIHIK